MIHDESYRLSTVSCATVADWAEGTLECWLPGYTDRDEVTGEQYRIKQLFDGTFLVETVDAHVGRRFRVSVSVVEET